MKMPLGPFRSNFFPKTLILAFEANSELDFFPRLNSFCESQLFFSFKIVKALIGPNTNLHKYKAYGYVKNNIGIYLYSRILNQKLREKLQSETIKMKTPIPPITEPVMMDKAEVPIWYLVLVGLCILVIGIITGKLL